MCLDVKVGGIESTNCHARAVDQRDTHIELVLDPMAGSPGPARHRRGHSLAGGRSWRLKERTGQRGRCAIKLLGRWIEVRGWMLFDVEHQNQSENTAPGRERDWRATAWEIHPVTSIEVVQRPTK